MENRHSPFLVGLVALLCGLGALACSALVQTGHECTVDEECPLDHKCFSSYCIQPDIESLFSATCKRLYGVDSADAFSSNTILIGSLMPYSGDLAAYGQLMDQGAELAVREINQNGGISGKKLGVLSCDSETDPVRAQETARHLIEAAKVPAIIGDAASGVTVEVFNKVAKDRGVLMISPSATAPSLSTLPDDNLLWRTAPSDRFQGTAIAQYILHKGYQKVGVIACDNTYCSGLKDALQEVLCATLDCADSSKYKALVYKTEITPAEVDQVAAAQPEIVVLIAQEADGTTAMQKINNYNSSTPASTLKRFIFPDGMSAAKLQDAGMPAEIICKVMGTEPGFSTTTNNFKYFNVNYKTMFKTDPDIYSPHTYDAAYLVAYAIAAAGGRGLTGKKIADGMARLSSGTQINPGGEGWTAGSTILRSAADATIDYEGASGPVNLDANGDITTGPIGAWAYAFDTGAAPAKKSFGTILDAGQYAAPTFTGNAPGEGTACTPYD